MAYRLKIVVATNNPDKAKEIHQILDGAYDVYTMKELGINKELEETGSTIESNSEMKAQQLRYLLNDPNVLILADDTGLFVEALGGEPGVYSARYAGESCSYQENNEKLLKALEGIEPEERNAQFRTCMTGIFPGGHIASVTGVVDGCIAEHLIGENGFGYDPIFIEKESGKTYAQMCEEEKNTCSHRRRALERMKSVIDQYIVKQKRKTRMSGVR